MKARIKWIENMAFMAESGSGHGMIMDGSPEIGGRNLGPRPMEVVLMGTGACSAIDIMLILKKGRQNVTDCWCELEAKRADTDPKVFTAIHFHYVVTGHGISDARVKRAIELSKDTYCSASAMLAKTANITFTYEVREQTTPAESAKADV
jgi:putative redox protein